MKTYFMYFVCLNDGNYSIEALCEAADDVMMSSRLYFYGDGVESKVIDKFESNGFIITKVHWIHAGCVMVTMWYNDKAVIVETVAFSKSLFETCDNWFDLFKSAIIILGSVQ